MNKGKSWKFDAKCEMGKNYLVRGDRPPLKIKIKQMGKLVVKSVRLNWVCHQYFFTISRIEIININILTKNFPKNNMAFFSQNIHKNRFPQFLCILWVTKKKTWTFIPPHRVKFLLNWILQAFLFTQIGNFKFRKIIQYSPKGGFNCTLYFANEIHLLMISFCKFEMLGFLQS